MEQKDINKMFIITAAIALFILGVFLRGNDPYNSGVFLVLGGIIFGIGVIEYR